MSELDSRPVVARQALVALAIGVGGAVAAYAVYTFGWHDNTPRTATVTTTKRDPSVITVRDAAGPHRIITLRYGDIVVRPGAAAQCGAYQEGGFPNLHCWRIGGGRHTFVFYEDSVQVYGPNAEPMTPSDSFPWLPKSIQRCRVESTGLRSRRQEHQLQSWPTARTQVLAVHVSPFGDLLGGRRPPAL